VYDTRWSALRMTRTLAGLVVLLVAGLALATGSSAQAAGTDGSLEDAQQVFCLAPAQRAQVVQAAVALGLAQPGRAADEVRVGGQDVTLETWRDAHRDQFDRTCAALFAAGPGNVQAPGDGGDRIDSVLSVLLPVLAGSLLTLLTTAWRDSISTRRLQGDALRSAAQFFAEASRDYFRGWLEPAGPRPSEAQIRTSRSDLAARLRTAAALHRRWSRPRIVRDRLVEGPLGDDMSRDWSDPTVDAQRRVGELEARLEELLSDVDEIADALSRPARFHAAMRAS